MERFGTVAMESPAPRVLVTGSLLSQLTDSLLRIRRRASVFSIPGGIRRRFPDICEKNSGLIVQVWKNIILRLRNQSFVAVCYLKEPKGLIAVASLTFLFQYLSACFSSGFRSRNTMSRKRQKRHGEPVDSGQAQKRRRLGASSAGGTSEAEPVDPRENAVEEVTDLPDRSSETEVRSSETEVSDLTDDDSVVQQEQSQQDPCLLRAADNSAALLTSDDEEELRDSDGTWPASLLRFLSWVDEDSERWQQRPLYPRFFTAADNSAVLLMSDSEEEQGDYDDIWPAGPASSLFWVDEDSELLEEYEQQRRNVTLRSQRHSDSSVLSGNEEDEAIDDDESEDDVSCPICMDFYSEILQSERLFLSTLCGHVFCSQCLPAAIEVANTCPICRTEVTHEQYHPIFL